MLETVMDDDYELTIDLEYNDTPAPVCPPANVLQACDTHPVPRPSLAVIWPCTLSLGPSSALTHTANNTH